MESQYIFGPLKLRHANTKILFAKSFYVLLIVPVFTKTVFYVVDRLREDGIVRSRPSSKMDTSYAEVVSRVRP